MLKAVDKVTPVNENSFFMLTAAGRIDPNPTFRVKFNDDMINMRKVGVSWATDILRQHLPNCSFTVTGNKEEITLRFNHCITQTEKTILVDLFKKLCKTRKDEIIEVKNALLQELQKEIKKTPVKKRGILTRFYKWLV